jgi:ABC-type multidrug transport system ATPase subunit
VIESLHRLTRGAHHTTVIASIHQPRADVFHKFDAVLLLSKGGHAVYCGTTKAMVKYFEHLHFACPVNSNPADYFVDLSSVDRSSEALLTESTERVNKLIDAFNGHQMRMTLSIASYRSDDTPPPSPAKGVLSAAATGSSWYRNAASPAPTGGV